MQGKVVIVTGASQGIGAEIARQFAAKGASVVINHRASAAKADAVAAAIQADGGTAEVMQADISQSADITRLVAETVRRFGRIDTIVNNAAAYDHVEFAKITEENFHRHFNLNVLTIILIAQAALPYLVETRGSIVNIGSTATRSNPPSMIVYAASKAAGDSLTKTLAREFGPKQVRINTVAPGPVRTEGVIEAGLLGGAWEQTLLARTSLGRLAETNDIAPVVVFLGSDDARWITGEILFVSGGG